MRPLAIVIAQIPSRRNYSHHRNLAIILLSGFILCLLSMPTRAQYAGGNGEPNDPFLISDPNHMQAIGDHFEHWKSGTYFKLVKDIDLSRFTGTQFNIIGYKNDSFEYASFDGVFDGNGHKILNFTYVGTPEYVSAGMFGYLGEDGQIRDLGLEDPNVIVPDLVWIGSLVGFNKGDISNCYVIGGGIKDGDNLGGLVGHNVEGAIIDCYATSAVNGWSCVGGLVGINEGGVISNCYATGSVTGKVQVQSGRLGGLVGENYDGTISNCYSTGAVTGGDNSRSSGGLVGGNSGDISNCYATGTVTGRSYSGGLGGLMGSNSGAINNCYATGEVTGGDDSGGLGGLVGSNGGDISNSYATGLVSGRVGSENLGGLVGYDYDSSGSYTKSFWDESVNSSLTGVGNFDDPADVIGETTNNMKKQATFTDVGWDFVGDDNGVLDYWRLCMDCVEYPQLSWQFLEGDLVCPDGVGFLDLAYFVARWLHIDCDASNNYCCRADLNFSGSVDLFDFGLLAANWHKDK